MDHISVLCLLSVFLPQVSAVQCISDGGLAGLILGVIFGTLFFIGLAYVLWSLYGPRRRIGPYDKNLSGAHGLGTTEAWQEEERKLSNSKLGSRGTGELFIGPDGVPTHHMYAKSGHIGVLKKEHIRRTSTDSAPFTTEMIKGTNAIESVALHGDRFAGLGFNIYGNGKDGIYVKDVLHKGPAFASGKIQKGDRIISVTISFEHVVFEDALTILSFASPYPVRIQTMKNAGVIRPALKHPLGEDSGHQPDFHPLIRRHSYADLLGRDGFGTAEARRPTVQYISVDIDKPSSNLDHEVTLVDESGIARVEQNVPRTPNNTMIAMHPRDSVGTVDETSDLRFVNTNWDGTAVPRRAVSITEHYDPAKGGGDGGGTFYHEGAHQGDSDDGNYMSGAPRDLYQRERDMARRRDNTTYRDNEIDYFENFWIVPEVVHTMKHVAPFEKVKSSPKKAVEEKKAREKSSKPFSSFVKFFQEKPDDLEHNKITEEQLQKRREVTPDRKTSWLGDAMNLQHVDRHRLAYFDQTTEYAVEVPEKKKTSQKSSQSWLKEVKSSKPAKVDTSVSQWHWADQFKAPFNIEPLPFSSVEQEVSVSAPTPNNTYVNYVPTAVYKSVPIARSQHKESWSVEPQFVPDKVYLLNHVAPYQHTDSVGTGQFSANVEQIGSRSPQKFGLPEIPFRRGPKPPKETWIVHEDQVPSRIHSMDLIAPFEKVDSRLQHVENPEYFVTAPKNETSTSGVFSNLRTARGVRSVETWQADPSVVPKHTDCLHHVAPYEHIESHPVPTLSYPPPGFKSEPRTEASRSTRNEERGSAQESRAAFWIADETLPEPAEDTEHYDPTRLLEVRVLPVEVQGQADLERRQREFISGLRLARGVLSAEQWELKEYVTPRTVGTLYHTDPYQHVESHPSIYYPPPSLITNLAEAQKVVSGTSPAVSPISSESSPRRKEKSSEHKKSLTSKIGSFFKGGSKHHHNNVQEPDLYAEAVPLPSEVHSISHVAPYQHVESESKERMTIDRESNRREEIPPASRGPMPMTYETWVVPVNSVPKEIHETRYREPEFLEMENFTEKSDYYFPKEIAHVPRIEISQEPDTSENTIRVEEIESRKPVDSFERPPRYTGVSGKVINTYTASEKMVPRHVHTMKLNAPLVPYDPHSMLSGGSIKKDKEKSSKGFGKLGKLLSGKSSGSKTESQKVVSKTDSYTEQYLKTWFTSQPTETHISNYVNPTKEYRVKGKLQPGPGAGYYFPESHEAQVSRHDRYAEKYPMELTGSTEKQGTQIRQYTPTGPQKEFEQDAMVVGSLGHGKREDHYVTSVTSAPVYGAADAYDWRPAEEAERINVQTMTHYEPSQELSSGYDGLSAYQMESLRYRARDRAPETYPSSHERTAASSVVMRDEGSLEPIPYIHPEDGTVLYAFPQEHTAPFQTLGVHQDGLSSAGVAKAVSMGKFMVNTPSHYHEHQEPTNSHVMTHHAPFYPLGPAVDERYAMPREAEYGRRSIESVIDSTERVRGQRREYYRGYDPPSRSPRDIDARKPIRPTDVRSSPVQKAEYYRNLEGPAVYRTKGGRAIPASRSHRERPFSTIIVLEGQRIPMYIQEHRDQSRAYLGGERRGRRSEDDSLIIDMRSRDDYDRQYSSSNADHMPMRNDVTYVVTAKPVQADIYQGQRSRPQDLGVRGRGRHSADPYSELSYTDKLDVLRLGYENTGVSRSNPDLAAFPPSPGQSPSTERRNDNVPRSITLQGRPPRREGVVRAEPMFAERIPAVPASPPPPIDFARRSYEEHMYGRKGGLDPEPEAVTREVIQIGPEETAVRTHKYYHRASSGGYGNDSGYSDPDPNGRNVWIGSQGGEQYLDETSIDAGGRLYRDHRRNLRHVPSDTAGGHWAKRYDRDTPSPSEAPTGIRKRDSGYGTMAHGGITIETRERPESTSPLSPASPISPQSVDQDQFQKLLYFQQQIEKQNEELAQLGIQVPLPPLVRDYDLSPSSTARKPNQQ